MSHGDLWSERETLANGLIVLLDERPTAESVALHLMARAGSRDDGPALGITALTSRLMFQGTRRRPSETALQREAALVGGTLARGTGASRASSSPRCRRAKRAPASTSWPISSSTP